MLALVKGKIYIASGLFFKSLSKYQMTVNINGCVDAKTNACKKKKLEVNSASTYFKFF